MTDAQKLSTIADIIREDASIDIHFEVTNADELARRILAAISPLHSLTHEAADEIEKLRAENATLKSQLEERGKEIDRLFDEIISLEAGENI